MKNTPVVEFRDVRLRFGGTQVLDGLSFSVQARERFVIIGQSGAGKTTILRLILGLLAPDSGSVLVDGRDVSSLDHAELRQMRSRIGMVFEEAALLSSSTVRENLALPLEELTDRTEEDIRRIVKQELALVGLADEAESMPSDLSGGMRKRVGLARALVTQPHLILFDEPTAGLDPITSAVIEKLIIAVAKQTDATSIITTPVVRTAFRLATRIAMLNGGRIVEEAAPAEFMKSKIPAVVRFLSASNASASTYFAPQLPPIHSQATTSCADQKETIVA